MKVAVVGAGAIGAYVGACLARGGTETHLVARGAEIEEVDWMLSFPVIRAKALLRLLLGYPRALAALSQNTADLRMWLSHYAPVPPEFGGDAA